MVRRATAGGWLLDEARVMARWLELRRRPLEPTEVHDRVAAYTARLATLSLGATFVGSMLGAMLHEAGHLVEARDVVERSIEYATRRHELLYLPDLLRLRGDLLAGTDREAARESYREAHARATELEMPLFARRAATRLQGLGTTNEAS
jgi:hypothetical protein